MSIAEEILYVEEVERQHSGYKDRVRLTGLVQAFDGEEDAQRILTDEWGSDLRVNALILSHGMDTWSFDVTITEGAYEHPFVAFPGVNNHPGHVCAGECICADCGLRFVAHPLDRRVTEDRKARPAQYRPIV